MGRDMVLGAAGTIHQMFTAVTVAQSSSLAGLIVQVGAWGGGSLCNSVPAGRVHRLRTCANCGAHFMDAGVFLAADVRQCCAGSCFVM
jgi:hypothetical protein